MANNGTTTYSFKDLVGALVSILAGTFILAGGSIGAGQFVIANTTTRSEQETSSDGATMVTYKPGSAATLSIEVQQTSAIHKFLLAAANLHMTQADSDDVSNWTGTTIQLRNILDGSQHLLTGCSFTKIPDKTYASKGGMLRWELLVAYAVQL